MTLRCWAERKRLRPTDRVWRSNVPFTCSWVIATVLGGASLNVGSCMQNILVHRLDQCVCVCVCASSSEAREYASHLSVAGEEATLCCTSVHKNNTQYN